MPDLASLSFNIDSSQVQNAFAALESLKASSVSVTTATNQQNAAQQQLTATYAQERDALSKLSDQTRQYDGTLTGLISRLNDARSGMQNSQIAMASYASSLRDATAASIQFNATIDGLDRFVAKTRELNIAIRDTATAFATITAAQQNTTSAGFTQRLDLRNMGVSLTGTSATDPGAVLDQIQRQLRTYRTTAFTLQQAQGIFGPSFDGRALQQLQSQPYVDPYTQRGNQIAATTAGTIDATAAATQRMRDDRARRDARLAYLRRTYSLGPTAASIRFRNEDEELAALEQVDALPPDRRNQYLTGGASIRNFFQDGLGGRVINQLISGSFGTNQAQISERFQSDWDSQGFFRAARAATFRSLQNTPLINEIPGIGQYQPIASDTRPLSPEELRQRQRETGGALAGLGDGTYQAYNQRVDQIRDLQSPEAVAAFQAAYSDDGARRRANALGAAQEARDYLIRPDLQTSDETRRRQAILALSPFDRARGQYLQQYQLANVGARGTLSANQVEAATGAFDQQQGASVQQSTEENQRQIQFQKDLAAELEKGRAAAEDYTRAWSAYTQARLEGKNEDQAELLALQQVGLAQQQRVTQAKAMTEEMKQQNDQLRARTNLARESQNLDPTARLVLGAGLGIEQQIQAQIAGGQLPSPTGGTFGGKTVTAGEAQATIDARRTELQQTALETARASSQAMAQGFTDQIQDSQTLLGLMRDEGKSLEDANAQLAIQKKYMEEIAAARVSGNKAAEEQAELDKQTAIQLSQIAQAQQQAVQNAETARRALSGAAASAAIVGIAPSRQDQASAIAPTIQQSIDKGLLSVPGGGPMTLQQAIEAGLNHQLPPEVQKDVDDILLAHGVEVTGRVLQGAQILPAQEAARAQQRALLQQGRTGDAARINIPTTSEPTQAAADAGRQRIETTDRQRAEYDTQAAATDQRIRDLQATTKALGENEAAETRAGIAAKVAADERAYGSGVVDKERDAIQTLNETLAQQGQQAAAELKGVRDRLETQKAVNAAIMKGTEAEKDAADAARINIQIRKAQAELQVAQEQHNAAGVAMAQQQIAALEAEKAALHELNVEEEKGQALRDAKRLNDQSRIQEALINRGAFSDAADQRRTEAREQLAQRFRDQPGLVGTPEGAALRDAVEHEQDIKDLADRMGELREAAQGAEHALEGAFEAIVVRGEKSKDAIRELKEQLASIALQTFVFKPFERLTSKLMSSLTGGDDGSDELDRDTKQGAQAQKQDNSPSGLLGQAASSLLGIGGGQGGGGAGGHGGTGAGHGAGAAAGGAGQCMCDCVISNEAAAQAGARAGLGGAAGAALGGDGRLASAGGASGSAAEASAPGMAPFDPNDPNADKDWYRRGFRLATPSNINDPIRPVQLKYADDDETSGNLQQYIDDGTWGNAPGAAASNDNSGAAMGSISNAPLWINRPAAASYLPLINKYAQQYNLDPRVLAELIGQESGFQNVPNSSGPGGTAASSAGGLGQQIQGNPYLGGGDRFDPETSIAAAAAEFSARLKASGGNLDRALLGYGTTANVSDARRQQLLSAMHTAAGDGLDAGGAAANDTSGAAAPAFSAPGMAPFDPNDPNTNQDWYRRGIRIATPDNINDPGRIGRMVQVKYADDDSSSGGSYIDDGSFGNDPTSVYATSVSGDSSGGMSGALSSPSSGNAGGWINTSRQFNFGDTMEPGGAAAGGAGNSSGGAGGPSNGGDGLMGFLGSGLGGIGSLVSKILGGLKGALGNLLSGVGDLLSNLWHALFGGGSAAASGNAAGGAAGGASPPSGGGGTGGLLGSALGAVTGQGGGLLGRLLGGGSSGSSSGGNQNYVDNGTWDTGSGAAAANDNSGAAVRSDNFGAPMSSAAMSAMGSGQSSTPGGASNSNPLNHAGGLIGWGVDQILGQGAYKKGGLLGQLFGSSSGGNQNYVDNGTWDQPGVPSTNTNSAGGGGLFGFLGSLFGGGGGGASTAATSASGVDAGVWDVAAATGGVFPGQALRAYENTIVGHPTLFRFAHGGQVGLMGEAGPEAIVPLARGADGKLGIRSQSGGGGGGITFNIHTPDADSFRRSQSQIQARAAAQLNRTAMRGG